VSDRQPDWDGIVGALERWRQDLQARLPSVSTVAEIWRHDPWAVLVSTIISLRTKDAVTLARSKALLEKAPGPVELLALGDDASTAQEAAAALIYPAGFYRTKASQLMKIAKILLETNGGRVPADMDALLALPGVGRKTANLVLIEAFDMDGVCVDTHVHRICNRARWLGDVPSKHPDDTEMILRRILPRAHWKGLNALLVLYGQRVCKPVRPLCAECVIAAHCGSRPTGDSLQRT
jgi:endonuclease-3